MTGFLALLSRDLRLVWRRPGDVAVVPAFFVVATVWLPLVIGAQANILAPLALPLCVPTLIFGAAAIETLMTGEDLLAHIAILAALALVALATTPWAMAAALRQAGE